MSPSTKRTLIILSVIGIVVIVLFIVSVAHTPGSDGCSAADRQAWQKRLFGSHPVGPGDLSGCTRALGAFTFSGFCTLNVAKSDTRSRQLSVKAGAQQVHVSYKADADGRQIIINADVKPQKTEQFSIGKDGQSFDLTCLGASSCNVTLQ